MKTRRRRNRRPAPRGWVLLAVMVMLLVMSLGVAGYYVQSESWLSVSGITRCQQVAASNAEAGMQEALRRIRSNTMDPSLLTGTCTSLSVANSTCPTSSRIFVAPLDRGGNKLGQTNVNTESGGGLNYDYTVFKQTVATVDPGLPTNRYLLQVRGYCGYAQEDGGTNSPSLISAIVEAEVDVGKSNNTGPNCTGGYECQ